MSKQTKTERYQWRRRAVRICRFVNALLAALVLAAVMLPGVASAAPRCPGGTATPRGCIYQPDPATVCAWPWRVVRVGKVALCVRVAPEVQP